MSNFICRVCKNPDNNVVYNVREMMFGTREVFEYAECAKCKCLQLINIPDDMSEHYLEKYYSFKELSVSKSKNFIKFIEEYLLSKRDLYVITQKNLIGHIINYFLPLKETYTYKNVYRLIAKIGIKKSSSILDVGCGNGELLYHLTGLGFKNSLGIDLYASKDIRYQNGLTILKKSIFDVDGKYDFIMLNHSFEHMENPLMVLNSLNRLLKPSGTCMIRIPTVSSYVWEHYRENWNQIDAPRHFFLHSTRSMELLSARAGFFIENVTYDSNSFQFWGSEQYIRDIPLISDNSVYINPERSVFTEEVWDSFNSRSKELNQQNMGDQAAFFLKKKT